MSKPTIVHYRSADSNMTLCVLDVREHAILTTQTMQLVSCEECGYRLIRLEEDDERGQ